MRLTKDQAAERDKLFLSLYEKGFNDAEIARQAGIQKQRVFSWRKRNHILSNSPRGKAPVDNRSRMSLYMDGYNDCEIAFIQGVTPSCICMWRSRNDLPPNCNVGRPKEI